MNEAGPSPASSKPKAETASGKEKNGVAGRAAAKARTLHTRKREARNQDRPLV